jgi:hypothetical protein
MRTFPSGKNHLAPGLAASPEAMRPACHRSSRVGMGSIRCQRIPALPAPVKQIYILLPPAGTGFKFSRFTEARDPDAAGCRSVDADAAFRLPSPSSTCVSSLEDAQGQGPLIPAMRACSPVASDGWCVHSSAVISSTSTPDFCLDAHSLKPIAPSWARVSGSSSKARNRRTAARSRRLTGTRKS